MTLKYIYPAILFSVLIAGCTDNYKLPDSQAADITKDFVFEGSVADAYGTWVYYAEVRADGNSFYEKLPLLNNDVWACPNFMEVTSKKGSVNYAISNESAVKYTKETTDNCVQFYAGKVNRIIQNRSDVKSSYDTIQAP